ncbi:MAG: DNA polymerase III subunit delta [candidate division KSB1 bacterium]|nr:DNA polymerase III subunit delta [candidate division KSB1 bacterium]
MYLFYGQEDFLLREYTNRVLDVALEEGAEDFDYDIYYGNEADGLAINNAAMSMPMSASRRVVLVRSGEFLNAKSIKLLARYSENPSPSTCLILQFKSFKRTGKEQRTLYTNSYAVEARPLFDNQVPGWIKHYIKQQNLQITDEAVYFLHINIGNSLRNLASEVEKIKLNIGDRREITAADVEAVVGVSREYNVFEFCDTIVERKLSKGLDIQSRMLQLGESPIGMLVMLTRHYTIMLKLKYLLQQNKKKPEIVKELRLSPYFVDNYIRQSQQYTISQLDQVFEHLLTADVQLKTSYQPPRLVMEILIFRLMRL